MNDFDPDIKYLDRRIVDALRFMYGDSRNKYHVKEIPLKVPHVRRASQSPIDYIYEQEYLENILSKLSNDTDRFVVKYKLMGFTNRDISKSLNVHETRVGHRVKRIKEVLS